MANKKTKAAIGIGAGIVAAAGYYFFASKDARSAVPPIPTPKI